MLNTPAHADNSGLPEPRRAKVRQRMGALAYLDIGPDNGGILLNLSEDGLALQAVAPLHGINEIKLGIQLPHSETRIETAAEIVWLGASSRQAGVRFLNLPTEARAQIREWIESQAAPGASSVEQLPVPVPAAKPIEQESPAPEQGGIPDSRRERWLNLMAEFERGTALQEGLASEPLKAGLQPLPEFAAPGPRPLSVLRPRPEIVPKPPVHAPGTEAALPAPAPQSRGSVGSTVPAEGIREPLPSVPRASVPGTGSGSADDPAESPADARDMANPRVTGTAFRETSIPLHPGLSNTTLAGDVTVSGSGEKKANQDFDVAKAPHGGARNQLVLVSLFALFSILCFGIGTWIGHVPVHGEAVKSGTTPPAADAAAKAAASSSAAPAANISERSDLPIARSIAAERPDRTTWRAGLPRIQRTGQTNQREAGTFAEEAKAAARRIKPGIVLPVQEQATPPAEQSSPPALLSTDHVASAARDMTHPAGSPSAALPDETAQPRIVNGYVLQPSDRFVPCHVTYRVDPVYPPEAREQGIQGTVKIHLAIAADGLVESERLISGPPQLVSAALDAAKYWQYLPALLNGQPVPTETDIEIAFRLPH
jgi:protein TonB